MESSVVTANFEEGAERLANAAGRRPLLVFGSMLATVLLFMGAGPLVNFLQYEAPRQERFMRQRLSTPGVEVRATSDDIAQQLHRIEELEKQLAELLALSPPLSLAAQPVVSLAAQPVVSLAAQPAAARPAVATCGDGRCEPPETLESCFSD